MLRDRFGVSERRACTVVGQHRSTQRLEPPAPDEDEQRLRAWLREFSKRRPRWGWRRAAKELRRSGRRVNNKRIQRLWREEGLKVPYRKRKKPHRGIGTAVGAMCPIAPNALWAMDFQFDVTVDGRVTAAAVRNPAVRRLIDAGSRRRARHDRGLVPPEPPHFDVRTPEYAAFPRIEPRPWECVRGMDKSFGYNACSQPDDFIAHDELLWLLVDVVAKGGNLLLNVGPRGVDAQLPDEHVARLDWLAGWWPVNRDANVATPPWIRPGTTTREGRPVRYTSRGDTVFAFVQAASSQRRAGVRRNDQAGRPNEMLLSKG